MPELDQGRSHRSVDFFNVRSLAEAPIGLRPRREGGFPIPAVEEIDIICVGFEIEIIETANVNEVKFGHRSRMGERMNPAVPAEVMLGDLLVEPIEVQIVFALQQPKPVARHANEHPALLGTDRTIASIEL